MITTDIHAHILPGVDDGPESLDESLRLAEAFLEVGTGRVVATPHVNHRWGVRPEGVRESYSSLVKALESASINLVLEQGGELELATAVELADEELDVFRIAGGEWILIEPPASGPSTSVHGMIYQIQSSGFRVIIAHPERCQTFQQDIALLQSLVAGGAMTQVTAGALTGQFGRTAENFSRRLLGLGLVHAMSADAHDTRLRSPDILNHLSQSGFEWLYEWLCQEIPEMIIAGGPEPKKPSAPARGTGLRRILRRRFKS